MPIYKLELDLNNGHDGVVVTADADYGEAVQMVFSGRDPSTISIRLHQTEDVRKLAAALLAAADALEATT